MAGGIGAYSSQDVFAQDARRRAAMYANQNMQAGYANQAAMQQQYLDEMSLMAAQQKQQAQQAQQAQQPEGCSDGKDDGKIGAWQTIKHFGKGIGNFFKGLIGFDKDWNFSEGRFLKNVAIGAVIAGTCILTAGTAIPGLIAAYGVYKAGDSLVNSGIRFFGAKTDAEAKAAAEDIGSSTVALAGAVVGAKAAKGAKGSAATASKQGFMGSIKSGWNKFTNFVKHPTTTIKSAWNKNSTIIQNNWKTLKNNWNESSKQLTVQEKHNKQIKNLETQIKEFKAKAKVAKGRDKAKYNTQVKRLEARKADIANAYDEINNVTKFSQAQTKKVELQKQIAEKQNDLLNTTNKFTQTKLNRDISALETKLEVYNRVIDQKVSLARNIRSELESIAKKEADGKGSTQLTARKNELLAQQKDLKFELPGKVTHKTYSERFDKADALVSKKQEVFDKAKAELDDAQTAYQKLKEGDPSAKEALKKLTDAKDAFTKANRELQQARIKKDRYEAYRKASSGYDYVGISKAFLSKTYNTVNNTLKEQYGSTTLDIPFVNAKIPFTDKHIPSIVGRTFGKFTVPKVSIPNHVILTGSSVPNTSVGGQSIEEMMLAQIGVTPQQVDTFYKNKAVLYNLYAMSQAVPQGYGYYQIPKQNIGHAPTMADYQQLDAMLKMYGIA